jgi:pimeloyl-ACP methyl ester carboxylesterase
MAVGEKAIARRAMIERLELGRIVLLHARPERVTRPAVLFVHGYFADATVWNEWLPFFAGGGFPAYALNLRGRGGSEPVASLGHASIADFADDARLVVRRITVEHGAPAAVGHSMGGLIVQLLAAEQILRAAVLIAPAPPRGISVLSPRVVFKQLKYLPAILGSHLVKPAASDLRELVLNHLGPVEQNVLIASLVPDSGRAGRDMSITGVPVDARRVTCPVLVVTGDDDHFIPRRISERVAERYGAPVRLFEGHGHMLIVERGWRAVAEAIADWLPEYV